MLNQFEKDMNSNESKIHRFQSARGQGLVEYALILVLVSIASIVVMNAMGNSVANTLEVTTCELGGSEDCECRVVEDVVISEYNCTAGDLFAYTAITTCQSDTELSLLSESTSSNVEYEMSYNSSSDLFEMTNSSTLCSELSSATPPKLHLVSRGTEYETIRSFRLGKNGVPISGLGNDDSGTGDSGTGDSGTGDSGTGDSGTGDSGTGDSGTGDSGTGDSGTGDSGTGDSGTGDSGTGDSGTGDSGTGEPENNAPVFDAVVTQNVSENTSKSVTFNATDADDDTLTYSAPADLPAFLTFDTSGTPTLTMSPDGDDSGTYSIIISVSDGNDGSDSVTFDVVVANVNHSPEFAAVSDQSVNEAESKVITFSATDADDDSLTYGASGTLPGFMTFNSLSNPPELTVSPGYTDAGIYEASIYVSDGEESDTVTFTVTVVDANRVPFVTAGSADPMDEGDPQQTVNINVSDADGDSVSLTASGTEDFMTFTSSSDPATLDLEPLAGDAGTYTVTITADDGNGGIDTVNINITVEAVVTGPSLTMDIKGTTDDGQQSAFNVRLTNNGTQAESNLSFRVYYKTENGNGKRKYVLENYWDQSGTASISGPTKHSSGVFYYTVSFSGTLAAGSSWQFNTTLRHKNWHSTHSSGNDWWRSGGMGNAWSTTTTIPIYQSGTLIFGSAP